MSAPSFLTTLIILTAGCSSKPQATEDLFVIVEGPFDGCPSDGCSKLLPQPSVARFAIDRNYASIASFQRCVADAKCAGEVASAKGDEKAAALLSWEQARSFCAGRGARLPTSAEWEKAARGALSHDVDDPAWLAENGQGAVAHEPQGGPAFAVVQIRKGFQWAHVRCVR